MDVPPLKPIPRLQVQDLCGSVFSDVSLSLAPGECVTLTGPSGSGKTVLLRAIADLDPNQGHVMLDGVSRSRFTPSDWRKALALVPAEPAWWGTHVGEHFPPDSKPPLETLGLAPQALEWDVSRCSSGERQRLALLRALVRGPSVLLLDEPTANLDALSRERVEAMIAEFRHSGGSVLWVTHDAEQTRRVARRHLLLESGGLRISEEAAVGVE